jgi:hypothetical protein
LAAPATREAIRDELIRLRVFDTGDFDPAGLPPMNDPEREPGSIGLSLYIRMALRRKANDPHC